MLDVRAVVWTFLRPFSQMSDRASHLSKGASPVVEVMAAVTPGVAFDLSVNLESNAFIGSILEAEVSSRLAFPLWKSRNQYKQQKQSVCPPVSR